MDNPARKAKRIERRTYAEIDALYAQKTAPVLQKYKKTLERYQALIEKERTGEAKRFLRSSGFLRDMNSALSSAAGEAGEIIRRANKSIMKVGADDDA